jgi:choline dehydrogenase-like flavoprotein
MVRMGHTGAEGVVDHWGTSFDFSNLHVASTAVFPSSSQATPTLAGAQFTLRLTDHLIQSRKA